MEADEYRTLFELETSYWWFRGLRSILLDTLAGLGLPPSARILDSGCGTGGMLQAIRARRWSDSVGFDLSDVAARYWPLRGLGRMCLGSVNQIPFRDGAFDAALSIDVLESEGVIEEQAYGELCRVVCPGGYVVLLVPAYAWLFNQQHHRAVHASRRYTKQRLVALLGTAPVRLVRMTHLFPTFLPPIAIYRLLQRWGDRDPTRPPRSDLRPLPRILNEVLFRVVDVERALLTRFDFPFGSSILAVAQRQPAVGI